MTDEMTSTPGKTSESEAKYRSSWSLPGSAERNSEAIAQALASMLESAAIGSGSREGKKGRKHRPTILEVASGFGHQICAVAASPEGSKCRFQPTEADRYLCDQIDARAASSSVSASTISKGEGDEQSQDKSRSKTSNVRKAELLDLLDQNDWLALAHNVSAELDLGDEDGEGCGIFDGVLVCNLTHVAPWSVTESLFSHLDPRLSYMTNQGTRSLLDPKTGWIAIYGAFNQHGRFTSEGNQKFDHDIRSRNPEFGLRDIQAQLEPLAHRHGYQLHQQIEMPAGNLLLVFRVRDQ
ncbi:hypothetical protein BCV70DRAFT_201745 [Testicularia cyperi]|uniref:DUF938-domain-containing protein n=1 Tax=Testicularia cyperi TaxID=1882483 RepID=A0A317XK50_9BASI|nr:hypothetical protein BCV70DRAFT_201745 [Testicularia cyperi]